LSAGSEKPEGVSDITPGVRHKEANMPGIHPVKNLRSYTRELGLRFVKKTANFDAPSTYHSYFGDETGHPGSILTFLPWINATAGHRGIGQARMKSTPQSDCAPADDWTVFHGAGELQGIAHMVLTMQS
jgi:catechol 2,3-dioxygenase-like lactoylglutathione lyase family enzyme